MPATGAYTVTQNAGDRTRRATTRTTSIFMLGYTVTDDDGDSALGSLTINVDDDTPTVTVTAGSDANVVLTTHDAATIGAASEAVSTTANFSGVFSGTTVSPGADGAGSGTTSGYALSTDRRRVGPHPGRRCDQPVQRRRSDRRLDRATSAGAITAANTVFRCRSPTPASSR